MIYYNITLSSAPMAGESELCAYAASMTGSAGICSDIKWKCCYSDHRQRWIRTSFAFASEVRQGECSDRYDSVVGLSLIQLV